MGNILVSLEKICNLDGQLYGNPYKLNFNQL